MSRCAAGTAVAFTKAAMVALVTGVVGLMVPEAGGFDAFIKMKDGYFVDGVTERPWVPHGIAYQTWNRPLGVWQTFDQIDYDLDEMVKMGANSIRVDFVWKHVEQNGDNQFEWENYDYLIQAAEARGIRIFALIGYQWPPDWFPDEWYTQHPPEFDASGIYHPDRWASDIINYEHPQARAQYAEWFEHVCGRYKDAKAIVGWIIGNESGYLGLWSGLLDGYDPESEAAFRAWCEVKYGTISNCNAAWGTEFSSFSNIVFVEQYREYGPEGAEWADMVQWREDSIGSFTAVGAVAAKQADTNHLISYSTVGMQWGEEDWRYHAEDRGKITTACLASNAPIDYFSVNNYPWSILGHESQNGHWGISYTKYVTTSSNDPEGVPVLYSETGFTSSETMWPGMDEMRQGPLVRNSLWESLEAGAVGTHVFAWHDRPYITDREKGFGILYSDRNIKQAFWDTRDCFNLMKQADIHQLLGGSKDPRPDIGFLWTAANDSQYNRYECEMQQIAGAMERLGYEPYFINLDDLAAGGYTNYKAIVLPRNMRVDDAVPGTGKGVIRFLREEVLSRGIHILASADLPGLQNQNGRWIADYTNELSALFGIDGSDVGGFEVAPRAGNYISSNMVPVKVVFNGNAVSPLHDGYTVTPRVWKYNDEVRVTDGQVWATLDTRRNKGFEDTNDVPAGWWTWSTNNMAIQHWFPMEGTNMLQMSGPCGLFQDFPVVQRGRYTASAYLRSNPDDQLRGGASARVAIEWRDINENLLGAAESEALYGNTDSEWIQYRVDAFAPSNAIHARRVIRYDNTTNYPNLLTNGELSGSGVAPTGWSAWSDANHDPDVGTYRSASNAWAFWWDSGLWQQASSAGFRDGDTVKYGGYLYMPEGDALRNGKQGTIELEFYDNGGTQLTAQTASPAINSTSVTGSWLYTEGWATVPAGATGARVIVRCNAAGDGRFLVDDVFLMNVSPGGSVFVDNRQLSPALVVKDHGTAKAAIFLFTAGDVAPDGDDDGEMDILPWKWRYDYIGAVVREYFGIDPLIRVQGTNAFLCLAEYRTCTNGATLWQVKNYFYDRFHTNHVGGYPMTFTITSDLFAGRTIKGFEQAKLYEQDSDGTIDVTLVPDGQEILLAYTPKTNDIVCQLADAPSVIHPFGDKNYQVKVKYDTGIQTNLVLKIALIGGLDGSQTYQVISTNITGSGLQAFYMWIPDANQGDANYVSTPDGGSYRFVTWLEDANSNVVGETAMQDTQLKWGVSPAAPLPTTMEKGSVTNIPVEWEELYEYLYWQHCPISRNDSFPTRIAVYRSGKTEAQFPGHFDRVNAVCDWLESLGYENGDLLDVSFDNITVTAAVSTAGSGGVTTMFSDTMETGTNGWTAEGLWHQAADRYASPGHSWSYNNGVHYNTGARNSGALVTPWIDLTNGAGATLSFKSWHETEDAGTSWDKKIVFISTDGTNWTQLLQVSGPGRAWVTETCDLTSYAGQRIKLRFFFDTIDAIYNQFAGWNVDDVRITSLPVTLVSVYSETAELGTNGWTADGLWHVAGDESASPTHSWAYNNGTSYNTGLRNYGSLVSPWIPLTNGTGAILTFKSWYETEDNGVAWDRKTAYITADGTNWSPLVQVSGANKQWVTKSYDLALYAGQSIRLKFTFDTIDAINNNFKGWYVDDIEISARVTVDDSYAAFADAFETGTNGWSASGLWHQSGDLYASASRAWLYNNGTDYNTGARNSGALVSPWIDLTAAESAALAFKSWYETEDVGTSWDKKQVSISTDGTNWTQLLQVSGANRQWTAQQVDLGAYAGQRVKLRFFFDTIDAVYNQFRGWAIDDVRVRMESSGVLYYDSFSDGSMEGWTRIAGAANWSADTGALRAWRIGNDDNIMAPEVAAWSNYTVSTDMRYNHGGPYFDDAELYVRFIDRDNYVKVLIQNFYEFWRLKFMVRVNRDNVAQGWVHSFTKATKPVPGNWYNLKVDVQGTNYTVSFDGVEVGSFGAPAAFTGTTSRIGVGSRAVQLGIWEPQKGYFFVDDDEYSYYSASGSSVSFGSPLNLDWGYLKTFFGTLILPDVYVMNDVEASNVVTWINSGTFNMIAMDGGVAMKNETGAYDIGRVESAFGVTPAVSSVSGVSGLTIGTNDHYVTMDYTVGDQIGASGAAWAWTSVATNGMALGTLQHGSGTAPSLLCSRIGPDPYSQSKVVCFNSGVAAGGQLTNSMRQLAQRAFEWARGQAYKISLQLKYPNPAGSDYDNVIYSTNAWALGGSGLTNINVQLPDDGIMTGNNMYWSIYVYPWDSGYPWGDHAGFYTTANDSNMTDGVEILGQGVQVFGCVDPAWAGRGWSLWAGYNTDGTTNAITFGIKAKGSLESEDNFDDGNYSGWTVTADPNIAWSVANGALRASVVGGGGYSYITRDNVSVTNGHITIEYDAWFSAGATNGGLVYGDTVLYVNPAACGWVDGNPAYTNYQALTTGAWHHVVVNIRDGDPYWVSDLIVDSVPVFMFEPIEVTTFTSATVGFLSPYYGGYAEWDNFRVADEQYSLVYIMTNATMCPTGNVGTLFPYVPDFDPNWWEHAGEQMDAEYEWYAYLRGANAHGTIGGRVYFAPRLVVEDPLFPTYMNPGDTVQVPIEWENLQETPVKLCVGLEDAYLGTSYVSQVYHITNSWGTNYFEVVIPTNIPSHENFLWVAYIYPTNLYGMGTNAFDGRIGLDDTFRFGPDGAPIGPETIVAVSAMVDEDTFRVYSDSGLVGGSDVGTWQGSSAIFDGNYTGLSAPEGTKCFYTSGNFWQGWGVFKLSGGYDMSDYSSGFLKFWVCSSNTVEIAIEDSFGINRVRTVPSTTNVWMEVTIPLSDFNSGLTFSSIKYPFKATTATAGTFYIDDVRWIKGIYRVYNDAGLARNAALVTSGDSEATFNQNYSGQTPPEGGKCFYTATTNGAAWSVVNTNSVNLRQYTNGVLCFWVKSPEPITIAIEGPADTEATKVLPSTGDEWYQFAIGLTNFTGVDFTQITTLFRAEVSGATTFLVDDVRWERSTNTLHEPASMVIYNDTGLPVGTDVNVWWASQYWAHVSALWNNGGFESSPAGRFPDTSWYYLTTGNGATAQVLTAAARTGNNGLRAQTGSASTSNWFVTYQEYPAYAGDIFRASAQVRQPSAGGWVAGSEAYVRLSFLDAWHQYITNDSSSIIVTTAAENWTNCIIGETTAPVATRYVRMELVVAKPESSGESAADFDDCSLYQANSFNGAYSDDPLTPEGTKCFRSYCVGWSGWGVFYTNSVVDLSAYSNGYLKFWYKSSGYTFVQIQSVSGSVTNTGTGASFGPTTNAAGEIAWTYKSVPISDFGTSVQLTAIKSPFMLTDPTEDRAFYVDDVRWVMDE